MATNTRTRRNIDDRIAEAEAKLKALQQRKQTQAQKVVKAPKVKLTRETAGMSDLLAWVEQIASENNIKAADVIKAAAKLKRTGLKFASK